MKKEYTKPNMEIVSFTTENLAADPVSAVDVKGIQKSFNTIKYY